MIDAHCHLNFKAFEDDLEEVIKRAKEHGVEKIFNVGTSLESSRHAVELAAKYDNLFAIVGIHPHHADKLKPGWEEEFIEIAKQKKVMGIGEIGLDYYSYQSNGIVEPKLQKKVFEAQIEIAHSLKLPLQIHNRHAGADVIKIINNYKSEFNKIPGVFHCFAGSKAVLRDLLNLGFYVGFDGNITYKGLAPGESVELRELAMLAPMERIIVETDAPYLTPIPHRGSRNEPSYVIITASFIANLKKITLKDFEIQTTKNVFDIFNI